MKLDKWPEEIECDGWRWKLDYLPSEGVSKYVLRDMRPAGCYYRRVEKLHVPPTMKEIMEHLLRGGWVRCPDIKGDSDWYAKLGPEDYVTCCDRYRKNGEVDPTWSRCNYLMNYSDAVSKYVLIRAYEWFEGEGK